MLAADHLGHADELFAAAGLGEFVASAEADRLTAAKDAHVEA
jgi:hypothetical protein